MVKKFSVDDFVKQYDSYVDLFASIVCEAKKSNDEEVCAVVKHLESLLEHERTGDFTVEMFDEVYSDIDWLQERGFKI